MDSFSDRLKKARGKAGLTQKELGEKANITIATVSAYENGPKMPSLVVATEIARACSVSLDWLCGLSDETTRTDYSNINDILKAITGISQNVRLDISTEDFMGSDKKDIAVLKISGSVVDNGKEQILVLFIKEWVKVYNLHKEHTIDDEMYNMWIEKKIKEYSSYTIVEDKGLHKVCPF